MSKFNDLYKLIFEEFQNKDINDLDLNISFEDYSTLLFQHNEKLFPLDINIIYKALLSAKYFYDTNIYEDKNGDEQEYLAEFSEEIEYFTKENDCKKVTTTEILRLFPDLINFSLSPVFISFFDFSNIEDKTKLLASVSNINGKDCSFSLKLLLNEQSNGICFDLRPFGINLFFLLFNNKNYSRRTIYHEWTYYIQRITKNKFYLTITTILKNNKRKENLLEKFQLNLVIMQHLTSKAEYLPSIDNLIYAIKETWKKYYSNLSKSEFSQLVIDTFKTKDINIINSSLYLNFLNTNKNFELSIKFLIGMYICFEKTDYIILINILKEKF